MNIIDKAKKLLGITSEPPQVVTVPSSTLPQDKAPDEIELKVYIPQGSPSGASSIGEALVRLLSSSSVRTKTELFSRIKTIEDDDYVKRMINDLSNDVLYRGYDPKTDGDFFKVEFNQKVLNDRYLKEVDNFIKKVDLYRYLQDMLSYIILRGERIVKIDYARSEIDEVDNQSKRLTIYCRNEYVALLYLDDPVRTLDPSTYLPLRYKTYTYVTDVFESSGSVYYIKMGDPLLSLSLIERLGKLKILENLVPMNELVNLDRKMYLWYNVPPGTSVDEAFKQARQYENMLQSLMTYKIPSSVDDLLSQTGKIRVIPLFGEGKTVQKEEVPKPDKVDQSQIDAFKRSLAAAAGGFSYRLFGLEDTETRISSNYLRLVERVRSGLSECVKLAVKLYLASQGVNTDIEKIIVTYPKVPGYDEIEKMDYMQMFSDVMSGVNSIIDSASRSLQEAQNNPFVNVNELIDFYNNKLERLVGVRPFKKPSSEELQSPEEEV